MSRPPVAFDVADGGLLTTIQDAGRPDWTHLGVPESGAADSWSLAVANLLVANEPGAAAVEMTMAGPTLVARLALTIGLAGADLGGRVQGGRRLLPGRSHRIGAGEIVEFPGASGGGGAREYLALPGGLDAPVVLGSRSTCLAAGFGGLEGRALRAGDTLAIVAATGPRGRPLPPELVWPARDQADDPEMPRDGPDGNDALAVLRVLPGSFPGLEDLVAVRWRVAAAADRVGIRLDGDPLPAGIGGETLTHGIPWGAIQVPPDGRPIVVGADHQSTGGYRVVGVVTSADRARLGQLGPGTEIRFAPTDGAAALDALRADREALVAGAAALRDAAGWAALIDAAGG